MAEQASLDFEGFSQVITKELGLTQQHVSRLADKDVNISSMEEFFCLKQRDLKELFPDFTMKQRIRFRLLKKQFQKEPHPSPVSHSTPKRGDSNTSPPISGATDYEPAVARPLAQMSIGAKHSHQLEASQALRCTQRAVYQLQWKVRRQDKEHNFIHYEVNSHTASHAEKVVLFVGTAGSGMELLLDFVSTFMCGISEDEKRQVQIPTHKGDSELMQIVAYTFPGRGMQCSLTIMIVPSPAFTDETPSAMCSSSSEHVLDSIRNIFCGLNYIDQLHGIAFVTNASKNTISPTEKGILDSMRHIFGDDIHRNLFILNTFADSRQPNAVTALHNAGIRFHHAFQFNCSPLLPPGGDCGHEEGFDKLNWQMSENSLTTFLQCIAKIPSVNLQNTVQQPESYE